MKYLPTLWSNARGSIGGTTYSQNRGGLYTKTRKTPSNPQSPLQQASRQAMAYCDAAWSGTLSQSERNSWILYGQTNPVRNTLGNTVVLSGLQIFLRVNIPLVMALGTSALRLSSPGAVSFLGGITFNSTPTVDAGTGVGGDAEVYMYLNIPGGPISGDVFFCYITAPCSNGSTPVHKNQATLIQATVDAVGWSSNPGFISCTDAFPTNRTSGSPWMIRAYWIRGSNLSAQAFAQGVTS
jgi:hypothetical protein